MKSSRRLKRMDRGEVRAQTVVLTSLMDIFIVIVIYLLMNQSMGGDVISPPKAIKLPSSVVETAPRQTVVMIVSDEEVVIQGDRVASINEVLASDDDFIEVVGIRMQQIRESYIGLSDESMANSTEVTILADQGVPFKVLRKLMSTSSSAGYSKISLAVNNKDKQN